MKLAQVAFACSLLAGLLGPAFAADGGAPAPFRRVKWTTKLNTVSFDWQSLRFSEKGRPPRSERLAEILCRTIDRVGAPESSARYDVLIQVERAADGAELALRLDPEYGRLELLTSPGVAEDTVREFFAWIDGSRPQSCEVRYAIMATVRVLGFRDGVPFARDATTDEAIGLHAERSARVPSVPASDYASMFDRTWETDDWALVVFVNASDAERRRHADQLQVLAAALGRWASRGVTRGASPGAAQATCKFLRSATKAIPLVASSKRPVQAMLASCAR